MADILWQRSNSFKKPTKYHCSETAEPEAVNFFFILGFSRGVLPLNKKDEIKLEQDVDIQ